ncbi:MAG: hypothetical protein CSB33_02150 [Desulfobacterales bacterium]|nr:MAG: hypothetical protein CSB33_02150 [Desulfobacterales bacterium]
MRPLTVIRCVLTRMLFFIPVLILFPARPCPAAVFPSGSADFTSFSLEELMDVEITSVSRSPRKLKDTAAAVFVITREDIRRGGVTSIPEALRMAPGVQVARISATDWVVNIRGMNEQFSNKLLVLIDGRRVNHPNVGGVFWDMQDMALEDLDRIEIIRGPNAVLWGTDAVNGVINIITRHCRDTTGTVISLIGGTDEAGAVVRYGKAVSKHGAYRLFAKFFNQGDLTDGDREIAADPSRSDWRSGRAGFRSDWSWNDDSDRLRLQGEIFSNRFQSTETCLLFETPWYEDTDRLSRASGIWASAKWTRRHGPASETDVHFSMDSSEKDILGVRTRYLDNHLEYRHRLLAGRHEMIWGLNGRLVFDRTDADGTKPLRFDPENEHQYRVGSFLQDTFSLVPDRLSLTAGAKLEYTDDHGADLQPTLRLLYSPSYRHSLWGGLSRAVRIPSRLETNGVLQESVLAPEAAGTDLPLLLVRRGNKGLKPEELIAWEVGYRFQPRPDMRMMLAGFFHAYDRLVALRYDPAGYVRREVPTPHYGLPVEYENNWSGESFGLETSLFWQPFSRLRMEAAWTFLKTRMHCIKAPAGVSDDGKMRLFFTASNPRNQVSLRSGYRLTDTIDMDVWLRYVDRIKDRDVDEYLTLDARLAWRPTPRTEVSVVGRNLLEEEHAEFSTLEIERSLLMKLALRF